MGNLNWQLRTLQKHNKDGSFSTQKDRRSTLELVSKDLKQLGFNQMNTHALKQKHMVKLVDHWKKNELSIGTIKNRLSHIRWWAKHVNVLHRLPDNKALNLDKRSLIPTQSKAFALEKKHLDKVTDTRLRYSIRLQSEFGLRREESIKFVASQADKSNHIVLKDSWCKGKRGRSIPIIKASQRELINEIKQFTKGQSLIPQNQQYSKQLNLYRNTTTKEKIGIHNLHGLRHHYAQQRYIQLTQTNPPILGGKSTRQMTPEERLSDRNAKLIISKELGHTREQITATYLGS